MCENEHMLTRKNHYSIFREPNLTCSMSAKNLRYRRNIYLFSVMLCCDLKIWMLKNALTKNKFRWKRLMISYIDRAV